MTVFIKGKDGKPEPRSVVPGLNDGSRVEVVSGDLTPGDSVIVGMAGTNTNGQRPSMPPGMGGGPGRR